MKTNEIITIGLIFATMVLGTIVSIRFNSKRDERQSQAFSKALEFSAITSVFIAGLSGFIFVSKDNFNIPVMYVFILIIIDFILILLMYEVYLLVENLEVPFIVRMTNERKVKYYSILLMVNFGFIFLLMAFQIYNSEVLQVNYKNFSPYTIGLFICLYSEAVILHKMPKKLKGEEKKERNKKVTLMIIGTLTSIVTCIISFAFYSIMQN